MVALAMGSRSRKSGRKPGAVRVSRVTRGSNPGAEKKARAKTKTLVSVSAGFDGRQWLSIISLLAAVFVSAIGVVYSTHESRMLLYQLQQLENERNRLQVEWGQLLLEQSSLVSQGRIEGRAAAELGMKVPGQEDVVIVRRNRK